jgi:hypothetical protein
VERPPLDRGALDVVAKARSRDLPWVHLLPYDDSGGAADVVWEYDAPDAHGPQCMSSMK